MRGEGGGGCASLQLELVDADITSRLLQFWYHWLGKRLIKARSDDGFLVFPLFMKYPSVRHCRQPPPSAPGSSLLQEVQGQVQALPS